MRSCESNADGAYIDLGKNEEAKEDFTVAVAVDPTKAEAYTGPVTPKRFLQTPGEARRHASLALCTVRTIYLVIHNRLASTERFRRPNPRAPRNRKTSRLTSSTAPSICGESR